MIRMEMRRISTTTEMRLWNSLLPAAAGLGLDLKQSILMHLRMPLLCGCLRGRAKTWPWKSFPAFFPRSSSSTVAVSRCLCSSQHGAAPQSSQLPRLKQGMFTSWTKSKAISTGNGPALLSCLYCNIWRPIIHQPAPLSLKPSIKWILATGRAKFQMLHCFHS